MDCSCLLTGLPLVWGILCVVPRHFQCESGVWLFSVLRVVDGIFVSSVLSCNLSKEIRSIWYVLNDSVGMMFSSTVFTLYDGQVLLAYALANHYLLNITLNTSVPNAPINMTTNLPTPSSVVDIVTVHISLV